MYYIANGNSVVKTVVEPKSSKKTGGASQPRFVQRDVNVSIHNGSCVLGGRPQWSEQITYLWNTGRSCFANR